MPKKSQTTTTTKTSDVSTQPFSNTVQKLSEGVSYKDPLNLWFIRIDSINCLEFGGPKSELFNVVLF